MPSLDAFNVIDSIGEILPIGLLGYGTYGEVVECITPRHGTHVSVKVTRAERAYRRAAEKEVVALQLLRGCRHAMQYFRHYEHNGAIHIIAEILQLGVKPRMKHLSASGTQKERAELTHKLATACVKVLATLHGHGWIHTDIKPDNLMIRRDQETNREEVVVIDFGSVREIGHNTFFNVQSMWYRAPEVALEMPYGPEIDSWSLGCVLFEMLTGAPLHTSSTPSALLRSVEKLVGLPLPAARTLVRPEFGTSNDAQQLFSSPLAKRLARDYPDESDLVNLIIRLLSPDPALRLSCNGAQYHPYVISADASEPTEESSQRWNDLRAMAFASPPLTASFVGADPVPPAPSATTTFSDRPSATMHSMFNDARMASVSRRRSFQPTTNRSIPSLPRPGVSPSPSQRTTVRSSDSTIVESLPSSWRTYSGHALQPPRKHSQQQEAPVVPPRSRPGATTFSRDKFASIDASDIAEQGYSPTNMDYASNRRMP